MQDGRSTARVRMNERAVKRHSPAVGNPQAHWGECLEFDSLRISSCPGPGHREIANCWRKVSRVCGFFTIWRAIIFLLSFTATLGAGPPSAKEVIAQSGVGLPTSWGINDGKPVPAYYKFDP